MNERILIFTAVFMSAFVINIIGQVVAQVVPLAVLIPIVASMVVSQLASPNLKVPGNKKVQVAFFFGLLCAMVVSLIIGLWFDRGLLAAVTVGALLINIRVAAICGIALPVMLDKFGVRSSISGFYYIDDRHRRERFIFLGFASLLLV